MQITATLITLIAAVAMVEASCVPIITCGMKKRAVNPHASPKTTAKTGAKAAAPGGDGK